MTILKNFNYHAPVTCQEVLGLLQTSGEPLLLGGGTFVLNFLKKVSVYPTDVISLRRIKEIQGVRKGAGSIEIGAMTRLQQIIESDLAQTHAPSLVQAAGMMATTPVRNMATIGGNVASRFSWVDLPAVLIAMRAELEILTLAGPNRMAVESFLSGAKDRLSVITRFFIPCGKTISGYRRHPRSGTVDIPLLGIAFCAEKDGQSWVSARLVVNTGVFGVRSLTHVGEYFVASRMQVTREKLSLVLQEDLEGVRWQSTAVHLLTQDLWAIAEQLRKVS